MNLQLIKNNNEYGASKEFYKEEKWLLQSFINSFFFPKNNEKFSNSLHKGQIELIIRPDCNQSCEYCYITHKNGNDLYPLDLQNISKEKLLINLKLILNYLFKNKSLREYDFTLFAGDLFYDNLIYDILDIFYNYIENYCKGWREKPSIIIPCNMSFIESENHRLKFKEYYFKFLKINSKIQLSASIDGKIIDKTRAIHNDDFYNILFKYCKDINIGFHPMIASNTIDNWIENYDWWMVQFNKYNIPLLPALLEIRDDNWTLDKIQLYIEFLDYVLQDQMSKHSLTEMSIMAFGLGNSLTYNNLELDKYKEFDKNIVKGQNPLTFPRVKNFNKISCGLQDTLSIRISDLAIVPCHRTCYNQYIAGFFDVKDDKIIDIIPFNVSLYIATLTMNINTLPKCVTCSINKYCAKGCLGAQYEANNDLFHPCETVCNLFKAKFSFLLQRYYDLGILQEAIKHEAINNTMKQDFNIFLERMNKNVLE